MRYTFVSKNNSSLLFDTSDKNWYIKNEQSDVEYNLSINDNLSAFLQFLYEDPLLTYTLLSEFSQKHGVGSEALDKFPIKRVIVFCIENDMLFWLDLSSKWLDYFKADQELITAIKGMINNSKIPQSIRHKFLKRLGR